MIGQRNGHTPGAIAPNLWNARHMPRRHEPASHGRAPAAGAGNPTGTSAGQSFATGALRGLVGAGPSQVGVIGALRARDVARPTPDDIARALAKPEPVARPAIRQETARQDAAPQ
jgi:hypothetical protein